MSLEARMRADMAPKLSQGDDDIKFWLKAFCIIPIATAALVPHFLVGNQLREYKVKEAAATAQITADQKKLTTFEQNVGEGCFEAIQPYAVSPPLETVSIADTADQVQADGQCNRIGQNTQIVVVNERGLIADHNIALQTLGLERRYYDREEGNKLWQEIAMPFAIYGGELVMGTLYSIMAY
jgi:hypothetical protein